MFRFMLHSRTLLTIVLLVVCAVAAYISTAELALRDAQAMPPLPRPNVVLISIDTLRADHLPSYGYDRNTAPFLAELADSSVVFERAYAASSWTVPSIVSLLTSLDPETHGITRGYVETGGTIVNQQVLAESRRLLPEVLRQLGYRTIGLTVNGHLQPELGFAQGFDRYECLGFADAPRLHRRLERVVGELRGDRPYFLWVHYFDPHGPYAANEGVEGFLGPDLPLHGETVRRVRRLSRRGNFEPADTTEEMMRAAKALYDSEIRFVDRHIRDLFALLPITQDDVVIVTSDHGEEFLDHGDVWHGHTLYEETVRVPLMVRLPGAHLGGRRVSAAVGLVDVLPTVVDLLELPPPRWAQGHSLLPLADGRSVVSPPVHLALTKVRDLQAIVRGELKYIHDFDEGRHALYDLSQDPDESKNLIGERAGLALELRGQLERIIRERRALTEEVASTPLLEERLEKLRSLGYLN